MQQYFHILKPDSDLLATFLQAGGIVQLQEEILMQIANWIEEYTPRFCAEPWSRDPSRLDDPSFDRRAVKLWDIWKFHLVESQQLFEGKRKPFDVARQVQQGKGYVGKGNLGGNPFRDILLVDQIIQGDQAAITFFYNEYKPLAMKIKQDEDWWQEFSLQHVLQEKGSTGLPIIASYEGKAGLSRWINKTSKRFLSKRRVQQSKQRGVNLTDKERLDILLGYCTREQEEEYHNHFETGKSNRSEPLPKPEKRMKWLLQIISDEQGLKFH